MPDDLTKWPRLLVTGRPVTPDQAAEILIRTTNLYLLEGNDTAWTQTVYRLLNLTPGQYGGVTSESVRAATAELGILPLTYLHNPRITSSWIGGPHGWCDWDGTIGCATYNLESPDRETLFAEWQLIASTWPHLDLTAQLLADEGEDDAPVITQWRILEGRATEEPHGPRITEPADLTPGHLLSRILGRGGERGITETDLAAAIGNVLASQAARTTAAPDHNGTPTGDRQDAGMSAPTDGLDGLPPFTGDITHCVKCGYDEAHTEYKPAQSRRIVERNGRYDRLGPLPERLERRCERCGYTWDEAPNTTTPTPADTPPATGGIVGAGVLVIGEAPVCAGWPTSPDTVRTRTIKLSEVCPDTPRPEGDHPDPSGP